MITCLELILADEPERKEAPDSNQDWALMFLNKSVIHLIESFLKKESSLEQARLEERRGQREGDANWLGIKLLREELGWNLVDENEEGVSGAAFLTLLNDRYAPMNALDPEMGVSFMESIRRWAEHAKRRVVILSVRVKGSGVASLVTMAQGESRPIRVVRWGSCVVGGIPGGDGR
jgi:hypothetical protein